MAKILNGIFSFIALILIAVSSGSPAVTTINPENAEDLLPRSLMLKHCSKLGYGAAECKSEDFFGVAVDLNGNGKAEFSIINTQIETGSLHCTLYRDQRAGFALIQRDFPCEIETKETRTKGWTDIKGIIFLSECEPLECEFTWDDSSYRQGACIPLEDDGCVVE